MRPLSHFTQQPHNCQCRYAGGYARMGAALQASGRSIVYSCKIPVAPCRSILQCLTLHSSCISFLCAVHPLVVTSSPPVPSGSWPAYVGDDETKKPFATYIQGAANPTRPPPSPCLPSSFLPLSAPLTSPPPPTHANHPYWLTHRFAHLLGHWLWKRFRNRFGCSYSCFL